jgi:streptogramin lyase
MKIAAPLLLAAFAITALPARAQNVVTLPIGFAQPTGVAVDTHGNVFVADTSNNAVKEIAAGSSQGLALALGNFNFPGSVVVDAAGNVFVADNGTGNGAIKEILAEGGYATVKTLFANFGGGLAIDAGGNLFVADALSGAVTEILAEGGYTMVKTLSAGSFSALNGSIAVDAADNVFVIDNSMVKELTAADAYAYASIKILITNDGGAGESFFNPLSIAVDANDTIFLLNQNTAGNFFGGMNLPSTCSVLAYPATNNYAAASEIGKNSFFGAADLTLDRNGNLFVTEDGVVEVPAAGGYATIDQIASGSLSGLTGPTGLAIDGSGNLFLAEFTVVDHTIYESTPPASYSALDTLTTQNGPSAPKVAVDASGNVFFTNDDGVAEIPAQGGSAAVKTIASLSDHPTAIAADAGGDVFIILDNQVQEIVAASGYVDIETIATANGNFNTPAGLAVDGAGNLFVADYGDKVVKKVLAAGGYVTVQTLPASLQTGVSAIAIDAVGNVYVDNGADDEIREIFAASGYSTASTFSGVTAPITGIAVDHTGNIFVLDNTAKVREILAPPSPLAAAILPGSRSVQTGKTATVLATLLNSSSDAQAGCAPGLPLTAPAGLTLDYAPTDPATNEVSGASDLPVAIPAGGAQTFVLAFGDPAPQRLAALPIVFDCTGVQPAPAAQGVNTVDLNFSTTATPDIIALAATASPGLTVHISNGVGAFALATINAGAAGVVNPEAVASSATLPLTLNICQTDASGQCLPVGGSGNVPAGGTATYSVFLGDNNVPIPFDPANSRVIIRFIGADGNSYGSTSVAVTTD